MESCDHNYDGWVEENIIHGNNFDIVQTYMVRECLECLTRDKYFMSTKHVPHDIEHIINGALTSPARFDT